MSKSALYNQEYETVEVIVYQGMHYPNICRMCETVINASATVFPLLKAIFCGDDCAAEWFAAQCETITSITDEEGELCIPS